MKKALAMTAMVVFLVALGAPSFANNNSSLQSIELTDEDPKKAKKKEKTEKKSCSDAKAEESTCCSKTKSCDDTKTKKK